MNALRRDGADALPRPYLRRPPLDEVVTFRVRVDLDGAEPPVWRMLAIRSDVTLDAVHRVLQAAYGWTDSHLHRFSLGGHPFDLNAELFLCPYDVDEGEDEGTPETEVRLDETVQHVGDTLRYVYDYGDEWTLSLVLEEVLAARRSDPAAVCTDGAGSAPPEDSGGVRAAAMPTQRSGEDRIFHKAAVEDAVRRAIAT